MTAPHDDRRAHPRYETRLELQGTREEGGQIARMEAYNLSMGGLYCMTTCDFDEMTRLAVRLMLPLAGQEGNGEVEPVDLEAVVVRRRKVASPSGGNDRYELGLFFTGVTDEARRQLADYLYRLEHGHGRAGNAAVIDTPESLHPH